MQRAFESVKAQETSEKNPRTPLPGWSSVTRKKHTRNGDGTVSVSRALTRASLELFSFVFRESRSCLVLQLRFCGLTLMFGVAGDFSGVTLVFVCLAGAVGIMVEVLCTYSRWESGNHALVFGWVFGMGTTVCFFCYNCVPIARP